MANILDYLDWRGDVPFVVSHYNEVDELVLCRLAYLPFEEIVPAGFAHPVTLCDAVRQVQESPGSAGRRLLLPGDGPLVKKLCCSRRFAGVRLAGYVNRLDPAQEKQFSAITMLLPDASVLVAFRGTDGTMIGWKEDFNMSFSQTVPAQREAVEYLSAAAAHFRMLPLRVCGHSKGGNLALFAAAFCPRRVQNRIRSVRNNDGPGFSDRVLQAPAFKSILPRSRTCLPQSAVFGMLLEHAEPYTVVASTNTGLAQHDLFSWQVTRDGLVYLPQLSEKSRLLDAALKQWMADMTPVQRAQIVDSVFEILREAGVSSMEELFSGRRNLVLARTLLRRDEAARQLLVGALRMVKTAAREAAHPAKKEENTAALPAARG